MTFNLLSFVLGGLVVSVVEVIAALILWRRLRSEWSTLLQRLF